MNKLGVKLNDILHFLGNEVISLKGNPEGKHVKYLKPVSDVDEYCLDWINPTLINKQQLVEISPARAIIVDKDVNYTKLIKAQDKVLIVVTNPKLTIAKIGHAFFTIKIEPYIHPTAVIHEKAIIGENIFIGAYCYIGECVIGNDTIIHPNVVLKINQDVWRVFDRLE